MDKTKLNKIKTWQEKLRIMEEEDLPKALNRLGEAAKDGDWNENAEYEDAESQVDVLRVKIDDVKEIIRKLEKEKNK